MKLEDRIIAVLLDKRFECRWPCRRSIWRLFLDDPAIPPGNTLIGFIRLNIAIWKLRRKGVIKIGSAEGEPAIGLWKEPT